jgi:hypothetical protein
MLKVFDWIGVSFIDCYHRSSTSYVNSLHVTYKDYLNQRLKRIIRNKTIYEQDES